MTATTSRFIGDLTKRQAEIYQYMLAYQREHGSPTTVREIMVEFDINNPNGVMCHLKALVKKGRAQLRTIGASGFYRRYHAAAATTKPTACPCCGHTPQEGEAG